MQIIYAASDTLYKGLISIGFANAVKLIDWYSRNSQNCFKALSRAHSQQRLGTSHDSNPQAGMEKLKIAHFV